MEIISGIKCKYGTNLTLTIARPFIGPHPFERSKKAVLYGRNKESNELFYMVLANNLVLFMPNLGRVRAH